MPEGGADGTAGVLVIQEWWGLVDQITRTCDRFAEAGFTALAPDLYQGTAVPLTEPDEAAKHMMALEMDEAANAAERRRRRAPAPHRRGSVGVVGFCMGGGLALVLACQRPDAVAAVVPAYGVIPWPDAQPDYSAMQAAVRGHVAELDGSFTPEAAADALVAELAALGKSASFHRLPRCRPRLLQRGPSRGLRRGRRRTAVGPHGGLPAFALG